MNQAEILKQLKMKSKVENMAHTKREKNKQSEEEWLQTLSKEERRKILLERLHKKTRRNVSQEDKFKELSEELQRTPLSDTGINDLNSDDMQKHKQIRKRKIKKIKQRISKKYPLGIPEEVYFKSLEEVKTLTDTQQKLYCETLINMYMNKHRKEEKDEEDLEF